MASASTSAQLSPRLATWVGDEVVKDFVEAERLTRESSQDPPEEPYRSLYAARRLLSALNENLKSCPVEEESDEDVAVLRACLLLSLGLNYLNTEEMSRGEELMGECLRGVEGLPGKVKTATVSVEAYNQLG
ncbi:KIF-binding protein, partial [Geodia barretti]